MSTSRTLAERTPTPDQIESKQKSEQMLGDAHPLNDIIATHSGPEWESLLRTIKRNRKKLDRIVLGDEKSK